MPTFKFVCEREAASGSMGFRPLHCPEEFDPVTKDNAYLFGHDLLEHRLFNDFSEAAEIATYGAMMHVRSEDYFYSYGFPWFTGMIDETVKNINSSLTAIAEREAYQFEGSSGEIHFCEKTQWTEKALRAFKRIKSVHPDLKEIVEHRMHDLVKGIANENRFEWARIALGLVALGYSHAKQVYRTDRMWILYREVTDKLQKLFQYEDYWYPGQQFTLKLNTKTEDVEIYFDFYDFNIETEVETEKRYSLSRFMQYY